jgi:hypothetical protein
LSRHRLGLLPVAFALAACGSSVSVQSSPTPAASLSPNWTLLVDSHAHFSVGVPGGWEASRRDDTQGAVTLNGIATRHPEVGAYLIKELTSVSPPPVDAVAADPTAVAGGYVTSFAVIRTDIGPAGSAPSLASLAQQKLTQVRALPDVKQSPSVQSSPLPGGPAARVDYSLSLPGSREAAVTAYFLTADRGGRALLFELVLAHLADRGAPLLTQMAATFRVT